MSAARPLPVALTIAGSDSGGGAGIQADLKTFEALGVFGASALTCVTAQNPRGVAGVAPLNPDMVARQIAAVREAFPVRAVKTGMLYSKAIIRAVVHALDGPAAPPLVVDPVMIAASGARLLREDAIAALRDRLLPRAAVITPNVPEAELLWGRQIRDAEDALAAAVELRDRFGTSVLLKGGHLETAGGVRDWWAPQRGAPAVFTHRRWSDRETHGCGCTLSAALAAFLARGRPLGEAARRAGDYVAAALASARRAGPHRPLNFAAAGARLSLRK